MSSGYASRVAELDDLRDRLREFTADREWGRFHDPKNLSMALSAEVGELLEIFQWKTTSDVRSKLSPEDRRAATQELADVLIYVIRLADVLDVDLAAAAVEKIALNEARYPIELSRGNATKYDRRES